MLALYLLDHEGCGIYVEWKHNKAMWHSETFFLWQRNLMMEDIKTVMKLYEFEWLCDFCFCDTNDVKTQFVIG